MTVAAAAVSASYTGPQEDPLDQNVKYTCTAAEGTLAYMAQLTHSHTHTRPSDIIHACLPLNNHCLSTTYTPVCTYVRNARELSFEV